MKLSYNWLSEYVRIDDIDPEEIALRLTMCTSEIEGVEEIGGKLDDVVIGRILEVTPHPDSDHLFLARVDVGQSVLDIVSGAPNTAVNTHVPVAPVGAKLPGGVKVRKARIRGAESRGMVCSEMELGISDDHSGLWILDEEIDNTGKLKPGTSLEALCPTQDYILDIDNKSITNRPDLWGHYGFAREISAIFERELHPLIPAEVDGGFAVGNGGPAIGPEIQVEVLDADLCPRYTAVALKGIRIEKSPFPVRRRLSTLGVRPISNIVDVTNYVMLLTGQPLHAFDAKQISHRKIIVRRAAKDETVTTLDAVERRCSEETLLITDPERAVAVAGVMGGLNSEIDGTTDEIIIEAANFNATSIRRTALRLGLRTEASNRFEKSLDPELAMHGLKLSASMVQELIPGASLSSPLADVYPGKPEPRHLTINTGWVSELIGMPIPGDRILGILRSLQFDVRELDDESLEVKVPSFRATKDVSIPQDLVEEVGRIYGYDNVNPVLPRIESIPPPRVEMLDFIGDLKGLLAGDLASTEIYTYSFIEDWALALFYDESLPFVELRNPVSAEMSRMRRNLIPNLFSVLPRNSTYKPEFSVFEIGSVYLPRSGKKTESGAGGTDTLPEERQFLALLMLGRVGTPGSPSVFFDTKGKLRLLCERLDLADTSLVSCSEGSSIPDAFARGVAGISRGFHPGRCAYLYSHGEVYGALSEINPKNLREIGIDFRQYRAAFFEIDVERLLQLVKGRLRHRRYAPLPRFPEVQLALAVVVDESVAVREVQDFIESAASQLMRRVELFDVYRGKPLEEGEKSLAFNLHYGRQDRTLTEKEANRVHEKIAEKIRSRGWHLR
jgi:phenylalanyl-tRNA synthetase beta chain